MTSPANLLSLLFDVQSRSSICSTSTTTCLPIEYLTTNRKTCINPYLRVTHVSESSNIPYFLQSHLFYVLAAPLSMPWKLWHYLRLFCKALYQRNYFKFDSMYLLHERLYLTQNVFRLLNIRIIELFGLQVPCHLKISKIITSFFVYNLLTTSFSWSMITRLSNF